jgi:putative ABC transport system permease protein
VNGGARRERSHLRPRDLLRETSAGILQRPGRSALTMLGTVLGIASFVAILGLTSTASGQIDKAFNVLSATEVTVTDNGSGNPEDTAMSFPSDADARIQQLNGVVHAGLEWSVHLDGGTTVSNTPQLGTAATSNDSSAAITVSAADPGAWAGLHPVVGSGRLYDSFAQGRAEPVAVLGAAAATSLGITRLDNQPAIFVGNRPFTVVGVVTDLERHPELLSSVIIPTSTALADFGDPANPAANMIIETSLGAAQLIASQAALALRPDDPARFRVSAPADPTQLRHAVGNQLNVLFLLLAGISLIIGAFGIANTTLVAVIERTPEIGLRRSLGARRRHIVSQFLAESAALGTLGGLIGTSIGVAAVIIVAVAQHWTAILQPWTVLPAPLAGSAIGLLAGIYPSLRAAWIEPIIALRR